MIREKLVRKLNFLKKTIKNDFTLTREFGFSYGALDFARNILCHGTRTKIGKSIDSFYYKKVERRYAGDKYFLELIDSYKKFENMSINEFKLNDGEEDYPIWIFWWQGFDNIPKVVFLCIESIKKYAGKHIIHYVHKDNFKKYCILPDYILEKFNNGNISITHFSDILRMSLLAEYGGIWMDATLFLTDFLPDDMCRFQFYTIHHGLYPESICHGKWSGFCLACCKSNPFIMFCRDYLYEYWKRENALICYLLIDVAMSTAYNNFKYVRDMVDAVPLNNMSVFELQNIINDDFNNDIYQKICRDANIHKLSYKYYIGKSENSYLWYLFKLYNIQWQK